MSKRDRNAYTTRADIYKGISACGGLERRIKQSILHYVCMWDSICPPLNPDTVRSKVIDTFAMSVEVSRLED